MKAVAVFPKTRILRLVEQPLPVLKSPYEVKVRILEVGVCGTDRAICQFKEGMPPNNSDYLIIGHESVGEVLEVGEAVSLCKLGDLVVLTSRRPCNETICPACRCGRSDLCQSEGFVERGIKAAHGFMTECVVDEEKYILVIPAELCEVGVLIEPLAIAEKAMLQLWEADRRLSWLLPTQTGNLDGRGRSALVLGAGAVGLLGAMLLRHAGFHTTVYSQEDGRSHKAQLVQSFGAEWICATDVSLKDLAKVDIIYEATGSAKTAIEALQVLGPNGSYVLVGIPVGDQFIQFNASHLLRNLVFKNQFLIGSVDIAPISWTAAIRDLGILMQRWPALIRALITSRQPMHDFEKVLLGDPTGIKTTLVFASHCPPKKLFPSIKGNNNKAVSLM